MAEITAATSWSEMPLYITSNELFAEEEVHDLPFVIPKGAYHEFTYLDYLFF